MSVTTLGSNIASLKAQRRLAEGTNQLSKTFERLSSGLRINKASDDAAGLSVSDSLRADKRVFIQGVRNLNDGLSLLNIADGALQELTNITVRIKELAEQSANGVYSNLQRNALNKEAQALAKEFTRITQSTKFNSIGILSGGLNELRLQGGYGTDGSILSSVGGAIGTGSFTTGTTYATENGPPDGFSRSLVLGDLNGDSILDLVTSGYADYTGQTTVRLGNSDGTFGSATSYLSGGTMSYAVDLSDLNNDGMLDLVTGNIGGIIGIRYGNGSGTFGSISTISNGLVFSSDMELRDLNGDGHEDIIVGATEGGIGVVSVQLSKGNGSFGSSTTYSTNGTTLFSMDISDINGDGFLDVATAGTTTGTGTVAIRYGTGDGTFGAISSYQMNTTTTTSVDISDLNNDGIMDIVASGASGGPAVAVRLGSSDGTFGAVTSYTAGAGLGSRKVKIGDFNGDGISDVVNVATSSGIYVRLGNGDGSFGSIVTYSSSSMNDIELGDLNGDGVQDIIAAGYGTGGVGFAQVNFGRTTAGTAPILPFELNSIQGARDTLTLINKKIDLLSKQRGQIGAFQSRANIAINVLGASSENYSAAESRIRDADIADESSRLIRLNILQQAAAGVLAQANQQPEVALKLLTDSRS